MSLALELLVVKKAMSLCKPSPFPFPAGSNAVKLKVARHPGKERRGPGSTDGQGLSLSSSLDSGDPPALLAGAGSAGMTVKLNGFAARRGGSQDIAFFTLSKPLFRG
jgi:hypothetical protein